MMLYVIGTNEAGAVKQQWPAADLESALTLIAALLRKEGEEPENSEEIAWYYWDRALESADPIGSYSLGRDGFAIRYGLLELP